MCPRFPSSPCPPVVEQADLDAVAQQLGREPRGVLEIAVLRSLADGGPSYGYAIAESLEDAGLGQVKGGTLTIDRLDGTRIKYTGVYTLKIGEAKYDGDNEVVRTIEFGAKAKN